MRLRNKNVESLLECIICLNSIRMVTYLYLYEGSQKTRNVGYAKIEKRDAHYRVEIHMKNTGLMEHDIPVYFYAQNTNGFPGILLGSIIFPEVQESLRSRWMLPTSPTPVTIFLI